MYNNLYARYQGETLYLLIMLIWSAGNIANFDGYENTNRRLSAAQLKTSNMHQMCGACSLD